MAKLKRVEIDASDWSIFKSKATKEKERAAQEAEAQKRATEMRKANADARKAEADAAEAERKLKALDDPNSLEAQELQRKIDKDKLDADKIRQDIEASKSGQAKTKSDIEATEASTEAARSKQKKERAYIVVNSPASSPEERIAAMSEATGIDYSKKFDDVMPDVDPATGEPSDFILSFREKGTGKIVRSGTEAVFKETVYNLKQKAANVIAKESSADNVKSQAEKRYEEMKNGSAEQRAQLNEQIQNAAKMVKDQRDGLVAQLKTMDPQLLQAGKPGIFGTKIGQGPTVPVANPEYERVSQEIAKLDEVLTEYSKQVQGNLTGLGASTPAESPVTAPSMPAKGGLSMPTQPPVAPTPAPTIPQPGGQLPTQQAAPAPKPPTDHAAADRKRALAIRQSLSQHPEYPAEVRKEALALAADLEKNADGISRLTTPQ